MECHFQCVYDIRSSVNLLERVLRGKSTCRKGSGVSGNIVTPRRVNAFIGPCDLGLILNIVSYGKC